MSLHATGLLSVESWSRFREDRSHGVATVKDPYFWEGEGLVSGDITPAELGRSLLRIESKLDRAIDDHEQRVRRLERWMWTAMGFGGVGALSGLTALLKAIAES